LTYSRIEFVFL